MLTEAVLALTVAALTAALALSRPAGRACYRIDRDAYRRAQHEWAVERRRAELCAERSTK